MSYIWLDDEVEILRGWSGQGITPGMVQAAFAGARTQQGVVKKMKALGIPFRETMRETTAPTLTRVVSETPERIVTAPEETEEESTAEAWGRAVRATNKTVARKRSEGYAKIRLISTRPVALTISSDWHLTPRGACDLPGLEAYAVATRDEPGAYAIAVGDLTDNPIKWSKQMADVPEEARLLDHAFGLFGSKMLATTDGNHDAWSRQFAGLDNVERLANLHRVHYAPDELIYTVEIAPSATADPTAVYVVATRHQYRRNSSLNWNHAAWRWVEDNMDAFPKTPDGGTMLPDIVAIGHNHCAEVSERVMEGARRWAARMGPWQVHSSHARQYGWARGAPTAPTFILHPNRDRPILGFSDYREAYRVLRSERAVALEQAA